MIINRLGFYKLKYFTDVLLFPNFVLATVNILFIFFKDVETIESSTRLCSAEGSLVSVGRRGFLC